MMRVAFPRFIKFLIKSFNKDAPFASVTTPGRVCKARITDFIGLAVLILASAERWWLKSILF